MGAEAVLVVNRLAMGLLCPYCRDAKSVTLGHVPAAVPLALAERRTQLLSAGLAPEMTNGFHILQ